MPPIEIPKSTCQFSSKLCCLNYSFKYLFILSTKLFIKGNNILNKSSSSEIKFKNYEYHQLIFLLNGVPVSIEFLLDLFFDSKVSILTYYIYLWEIIFPLNILNSWHHASKECNYLLIFTFHLVFDLNKYLILRHLNSLHEKTIVVHYKYLKM